MVWEAPEQDGGEPITSYKVERLNVDKKAWILVGDTNAETLTIKATKLTEGHTYHFRVVAENTIGVSDPCQTQEPITAKLPFGKTHRKI